MSAPTIKPISPEERKLWEAHNIQALREWGLLRGSWLAARRLIRCHPFSPGGIDPVPKRVSSCEFEVSSQEQEATSRPS